MRWFRSVLALSILACHLGISLAVNSTHKHGSYDLTHPDYWRCLDGSHVSGTNLSFHSMSRAIVPQVDDNSGKPPNDETPNHQPLVNLFGSRFIAKGPFTISFTIEIEHSFSPVNGLMYKTSLTSGWVPMLNIYGTNVPFIYDESFADSVHLGVGLEAGCKALLVYIWDGIKYQPTKRYHFEIPGHHSGHARVQLFRRGNVVSFKVNGKSVGKVSHAGLFENGKAIYFGTDVPHGKKMSFTEFKVSGSIHLNEKPAPFLKESKAIAVKANSLRALAANHGLNIGTCVAVNQLFSAYEPIYERKLAENFNMITPENAMKFQFIHPEPDKYSFCEADALVNWAADNGIRYHGHCLVWGESLPWWVSFGNYDSSRLKEILHDHVTTLVKRYKGKIAEWDVLNEPMQDDVDSTGSRHSIWRDVAFKGDFDNYVHTVFKWARGADPNALLCLNEYGVDIPTRKADALFKVVKKHIQKLGTPIDCIGLQNHYDPSDGLPTVNQVLSQIRRYNKIGVDVRISELDKDIEDHTDKSHLEHQAKYFLNVLKACMLARKQSNTQMDSETNGRKQGTCIGYAFWGFTDKYSSLAWGTKPDEIGHGMIMDEHYKPKPGYTAIYNYLKSYH